MDGPRFDRFVKGIAVKTNRRWMLRGLIVGTVSLLGLAHGSRVTEAAPNRCAAQCSQAHGAGGATCRQACKQCGDLDNVCGNIFGNFICCPGGQGNCCHSSAGPVCCSV